MKLSKTLSLLLLMPFLFIACDKEEEEAPVLTCPDEVVTYTNQAKAIIDANCATAGCHGDNTAPGNFTSLSGLQFYLDNGQFVTRVLEQRSMPPAPNSLSNAQLNTLRCWAEGGFME